MGCFSWHCAGCDLPILIADDDAPKSGDWCFKCEESFTEKDGAVQPHHLLNLDGTVNTVEKYEGYGMFGEKDAYAWLAQNNTEGIAEWDRAVFQAGQQDELHYDEPFKAMGDNDGDRDVGICMTYDRRKWTNKELDKMLQAGQTVKEEDLYDYAENYIKNPIKILCDTCYKQYHKHYEYNDFDESRTHDGQGFTSAENCDVGWVCEDCLGW